ncbi:thiol peroxidase [Clostridium fallax]|uniref:Thiol peroxidase, atypical 2-Cys peroxiredoxin n=1 Tax=Clostridium fallax TaxID=1533 RepID=A0A1M4WMX9_9CLOT|nr:thiol peroxidase [Clostridium fallax]SHE82564.1 thiol peroxidase, atypical 2-Cys peroxiredoxin [Clostridium fallax]SQB06237.1 thiol peroxidase [Clostridium fallax]
MKVKFQGAPVTLLGNQVKVGDTLKDFTVIDNELKPRSLKDTKGVRIFLSVPSIDTPVCDMEVKKFNEEIEKLKDISCYTISMDLPFAQARWCGAEGVKNVETFSDYKDREFGKVTGTYIEELGLLTRASFIVDENNKLIFVEYLEEITSEPSYDVILKEAKNAMK